MDRSNPQIGTEAIKRRVILLTSGIFVTSCGANLILAVLGEEAPPPWLASLLALALGIGGLSGVLGRRGWLNSALVAQIGLAIGIIGTLHHTMPSADTAPYYAVPLVLLAVMLLPGRTRLWALAVAIGALLGIRLACPFEDPDAVTHTLDLMLVLLTSSVLALKIRSGWESTTRELERTLEQLAIAEHDQRTLREQAEAASQTKSRFLANMSHELRTPLNAVIGYAEMLAEDEQTSSEGRADADRIHAAGRHLLGIVDDVLDLARVESGGREPRASVFMLEALGSEVADWIAPQLRQQGNHLAMDLPPLQMETDRLMVRQILLNLLGNANKFSDHSTIEISGRVSGDGVELAIRDEGIGMAPEEQARVLEPFCQANDDVVVRYGGTGLGLSIVDRFSRRLGGRLQLASEVGKGTTFTVWLPSRIRDTSTEAA